MADEPKGPQIFVRWMDAEGATSQVTRLAGGSPNSIDWSPDGKWISFARFVPSTTPASVSSDMPAPPPNA
jgi:Tol biopolymer transport system component